jgi:hypothetical protein
MTSLEGGLSILSCRRKPDIAISVGALDVALYEIINYKLRILREHIKDYNSEHGDPERSALWGTPKSRNCRFQQGKLGLRGFEAKAISASKMKAKQGPPFEGPKPEAGFAKPTAH